MPTTTLPTRLLGLRTVSAIGLGAMPLSIEGRPDEPRAIATVHAALDAGVTLIDTADAYHLYEDEVGHNERLVARALASYDGDTSDVVVATKGGHLRPGDGTWTQDGSAAHLIAAAEASRDALGAESIDLYQLHRPDPHVRFSESVDALKHLLDHGIIRMAGLSNVDVDQIDEAMDLLDGQLVSVQNQFSPGFRSSLPELRKCADLGLAFLPWSPLGGSANVGGLGSSNAAFQQVADDHGVSAQQVALAWQLALAPVVIPIPGSTRPETIQDSAKAATLELSPEEIERLSA